MSDHDDALDREVAARMETGRAEMRLRDFLARRPRKFAAPGQLHPRLVTWAEQVIGGGSGNLAIFGPVGAGKTWQVWHLGEHLLRGGLRGEVEIVTAWRFKLLATPPPDVGELERLARVAVAAFDDAGAVRISDWDADHLGGIIDERWANGLPTIIAGNLAADECDAAAAAAAAASQAPGDDAAQQPKTPVQRLLGDRIASRLADELTPVIISGEDRRRGRNP